MKRRELSISNQLRLLDMGDSIEFPLYMRDVVNATTNRESINTGFVYSRKTNRSEKTYTITRMG